MRFTNLRSGLAVGRVALAIVAGAAPASAQERHKIEIAIQIRHVGAITAVAFSPDGMRLIAGSEDETLKLWEAATGKLIRTFGGHASGVDSVAFSPEGTRLLSSGRDRTLKL